MRKQFQRFSIFVITIGFMVGLVVLRGIELCEPCSYLEKCTFPGIKKALLHRGGLRAEVLTGGTIRPGDAIRPCE